MCCTFSWSRNTECLPQPGQSGRRSPFWSQTTSEHPLWSTAYNPEVGATSPVISFSVSVFCFVTFTSYTVALT